MEEDDVVSRNNTSVSFRQLTPQQSLRRLGLCSPKGSGQQASPVVFPEKRNRVKSSRRIDGSSPTNDKGKREEIRVEIVDEHSDLLGNEVITGNLVFVKGKKSKGTEETITDEMENKKSVVAKLTSKAFVWGSTNFLSLDDVISVSHSVGVRHFTVHSYPMKKVSIGLSCFVKGKRTRSDFRFLAPSPEEALQWVCGFADQHCFINRLPHPLVSSSKKVFGDSFVSESSYELQLKCRSSLRMLVILNPRSGRGRSSKVFHGLVEPIFKLAGFEMEVVKTTRAGHAKSLACNADFRTCPDGIICVGGDGIVNEVLNGLLSRDNQKEAISIPIGIIPAGSDNSLVWTVLGVRDPVSAAISIVKGGLTATDVFAVHWIQTGAVHFGMTVSYYGFVSDVLELSEKYQKRFGPLRYFVAGLLKFICLPKYSFEVEYLPASKNPGPPDGNLSGGDTILDMYDLYPDVMGRSNPDAFPRASSLSSIDSIMTPGRTDPDAAAAEPSDYVRGLDPRSKRLSLGRRHQPAAAEPEEVVRPLPVTPSWPRTRSRSRVDRGWNGLTTAVDREDISSTMSDPGPIWDGEPKWDADPTWRGENPVELPERADEREDDVVGPGRETVLMAEEKWVTVKGRFLGVLVCNHGCRTVQSLSSLIVAPGAEHDDGNLDLLLVRGGGRLRLLRFFLLLQLGRHLTLGYVDCVKVKSVRIRPGKNVRSGCGIDGELCALNGQVVASLLPEQCRLIGRPHNSGNV